MTNRKSDLARSLNSDENGCLPRSFDAISQVMQRLWLSITAPPVVGSKSSTLAVFRRNGIDSSINFFQKSEKSGFFEATLGTWRGTYAVPK